MADSDQVRREAPKLPLETSRDSKSLRILSTVVLGTIGGLVFVGNFGMLAYRIFVDDSLPWHEVPFNFKFWEVEFRAIVILAGFAWILAASLIYQRRVKSGWIIAVVALVAFLINGPTNQALRHYFAGDRYRLPDWSPPPNGVKQHELLKSKEPGR